jgi:quercetin dioxygenase-like cupin family protein
MEMRTRRIVTGHDDAGHAVFLEDRQLAGAALGEDAERADVAFVHLWATTQMPIDNSDDTIEAQRAGSASTVTGTGQGSVFRVGVLGPGSRSPMHRTESLDYGICLEGECDLELDSGDVITLRAGDIVIQRGTNHRWHNRSGAPCRFAWILLDAHPIVVAGRQLPTSWQHD